MNKITPTCVTIDLRFGVVLVVVVDFVDVILALQPSSPGPRLLSITLAHEREGVAYQGRKG